MPLTELPVFNRGAGYCSGNVEPFEIAETRKTCFAWRLNRVGSSAILAQPDARAWAMGMLNSHTKPSGGKLNRTWPRSSSAMRLIRRVPKLRRVGFWTGGPPFSVHVSLNLCAFSSIVDAISIRPLAFD